MGNQAGIIIRNVKNELFHSAKRLILNEVKGIECLLCSWESTRGNLLGKKENRDLEKGDRMKWEYIEK